MTIEPDNQRQTTTSSPPNSGTTLEGNTLTSRNHLARAKAIHRSGLHRIAGQQREHLRRRIPCLLRTHNLSINAGWHASALRRMSVAELGETMRLRADAWHPVPHLRRLALGRFGGEGEVE